LKTAVQNSYLPSNNRRCVLLPS